MAPRGDVLNPSTTTASAGRGRPVGAGARRRRAPRASGAPALAAAEFFAGIGLVRMALERAGIEVVWANDIEPIKQRLYAANFSATDYHLGDVREVGGGDLPAVALATASFPCTDLSLAGWRRGLAGTQSGMFWEFTRVLEEMGPRRPEAVLLENVPGFATSHGGKDLLAAIERLNELGYVCDVFQVDAAAFVPQSRPRLFIVGTTERVAPPPVSPDVLRPRRLVDVAIDHPWLELQAMPITPPVRTAERLADVVERFSPTSAVWWDDRRTAAFLRSLAPLHAERLAELRSARTRQWRTAYRRTRNGVAIWEIRADEIAGCLRTARGGSSKQAVVEAGRGSMRVRWMTAREYARLQGAPDSFAFDDVTDTQAMFGFGDAVCVPVVAWIATEYLRPVLASEPR